MDTCECEPVSRSVVPTVCSCDVRTMEVTVTRLRFRSRETLEPWNLNEYTVALDEGEVGADFQASLLSLPLL